MFLSRLISSESRQRRLLREFEDWVKQERYQTKEIEVQAFVWHVLVDQHLFIPLNAKSQKSHKIYMLQFCTHVSFRCNGWTCSGCTNGIVVGILQLPRIAIESQAQDQLSSRQSPTNPCTNSIIRASLA